MSALPPENSSEIDECLQQIFDEQYLTEESYAEELASISRDTDEVIEALQMHGASIDHLLAIRSKLGEQTGMHTTLDTLRVLVESADLEAADEKETHVIRNNYHVAIAVIGLAARLGVHRLAPSTNTQREAEADIIADDAIAAENKAQWLEAIASLWHEEGLDPEDPETYILIENTLRQRAAEDAAQHQSKANSYTLRQAFASISQELNIPSHDDMQNVVSLLSQGLGAVVVDPEKQLFFRSFSLAKARKTAHDIGWSETLFADVVDRLRQIDL